MSERKLGKEGKVARLKLWLQQKLRIGQAVSQRKFTPMPRKPRLSKRYQPHPSYYTKRWTPSRLRDRYPT